MRSFAEEFENIIESTDRALWAAYLTSPETSKLTTGVQIRFPRNRQGDVRVSEQEARFVLTGQLARSQLLYSVETPTSLPYQFTGDFGLSGQTDVTVYTPSGEIMWNLEFKAHGFSEDRANRLSIQKDIEKLICEPSPAYWFHTFEGVDNYTLSIVWRAFLADIRQVAQRLSVNKLAAKPFTFHASVMRQGFSVEQKLWVDPEIWMTSGIPALPGPIYSVTRSGLVDFQAKDGWAFRRHEMN